MNEKTHCDYCGSEITEQSGTWVGNDFLCECCVEEQTLTCERGGSIIWTNDSVSDDNLCLCQECFDSYFNRFVINETEAKAVMMIFSMYLSGYGYQQIAETLNREGYRTKSGNLFVKSSFQSILTNEKYTGVYIFNRAESKGYDNKRNNHRNKPPEEIIRIEGGVPAIISREVFEEAQKIRRLKRNVLHHSKTLYHCSSVIKCGCCGAKMYGSLRYKNHLPHFNTYFCKSRKDICDNIKEIDKESLDAYTGDLVLKKCFDSDEKQHEDLCSMDRTSPAFRSLLQKHIQEIVVYRDYVIFKLYVNGKVRSYKCKRIRFKTASQKANKLH